MGGKNTERSEDIMTNGISKKKIQNHSPKTSTGRVGRLNPRHIDKRLPRYNPESDTDRDVQSSS